MRTFKPRRIAILASLLALTGLALAAGPASAWTPENLGMKTSGTLTFKLNGANAKTCTIPSENTGQVLNKDDFEWFGNYTLGSVTLPCSGGGAINWSFDGNGSLVGGSYEFSMSSYLVQYNTQPWGTSYINWHQEPWKASWVNASGSTPSHITLSEKRIGYALKNDGSTPPITVTGTIYFTTLFGGGSLTLP